jgi:hypothetical protein
MVMFFIRAKRAATEQARRRTEAAQSRTISQPMDRLGRPLVMELAAVIFQLFSLSLFSGTCLLLFVSALKFWTAK